ncbi:MAG: hypothetical protein QOD99_2318 [Chthoniobacter sp.]|nr:hypothetical protein [Chthoniobacter sp.]
MTWFYAENDQQRGPFDHAAWRALIAEGKVTAETLVWHEGLDHWTRYGTLSAQGSTLPAPDPEELPLPDLPHETPEQFMERISAKDYEVDIGACMRRSWDLLRAHFWPLVGATLLTYAIIAGGSNLPCIGVVMPLAFSGVFAAGLYAFFLRSIRGNNPEFSELFCGFHSAVLGQLALKTFVTAVVMMICFAPGIIGLAVSGAITPHGDLDPENIESVGALVGLGLLLLGAMPAFYLAFCWVFALPLIIDRGLKWWPAMKLSYMKVHLHPWKVSVLLIVAGLAGVAGGIALCVGIVFTLPLYVGAISWLYLDIFDEDKT